jgi:hypothetical protein
MIPIKATENVGDDATCSSSATAATGAWQRPMASLQTVELVQLPHEMVVQPLLIEPHSRLCAAQVVVGKQQATTHSPQTHCAKLAHVPHFRS